MYRENSEQVVREALAGVGLPAEAIDQLLAQLTKAIESYRKEHPDE